MPLIFARYRGDTKVNMCRISRRAIVDHPPNKAYRRDRQQPVVRNYHFSTLSSALPPLPRPGRVKASYIIILRDRDRGRLTRGISLFNPRQTQLINGKTPLDSLRARAIVGAGYIFCSDATVKENVYEQEKKL